MIFSCKSLVHNSGCCKPNPGLKSPLGITKVTAEPQPEAAAFSETLHRQHLQGSAEISYLRMLTLDREKLRARRKSSLLSRARLNASSGGTRIQGEGFFSISAPIHTHPELSLDWGDARPLLLCSRTVLRVCVMGEALDSHLVFLLQCLNQPQWEAMNENTDESWKHVKKRL